MEGPSPGGAPAWIAARWLLDGSGGPPRENALVMIQDGRIARIIDRPASGPAPQVDFAFPAGTLMPGLIDVHAHFTFGTGDRTYEDVMANDSDERMVARGLANCRLHLSAGVTTARDAGARSTAAFRLRDAVAADPRMAPRLLVSGPPITTTGGHFWFCRGEADGAAGVAARAAGLLRQGADFLKIMASGGGSVGSDPGRAQYKADEIAAAVRAGHEHGARVIAHCLSADSVAIALEAGVDELEHINFLHPDGRREMSDQDADRIAASGVFVSPTIQTGFRALQALRANPSRSAADEAAREALERKLATKLEFVGRLHRLGVPIVAGTDAIEAFGDYAIGLELLVEAGLTPSEAVRAATADAARAIGLEGEIGSLAVGAVADLVVVDGDASREVGAIARPLIVMRSGIPVAGSESPAGA